MRAREKVVGASSDQFRIFETDIFSDDLAKIVKDRQRKLREKLQGFVYPQLRQQPYFGNNIKKLKGMNPETWRYRIGDLRLFYGINGPEKIVQLLAVKDRKNAYDQA